MKNFRLNFKSIVQNKARWLLTLITILTLGVGQAKAWYIKGTFDTWASHNMGSSSEYTYWNVSSGTYYYQLSSDNSSWSGDDLVNNKSTWDDHKSLQNSDFGLTSGQMTLKIPENSNITFKVTSSWSIAVYVRPAYYIKYDWYDGTWAWSGWMVRCGNGTYATEGKYRKSCTSFNYDNHDPGGSSSGAGSSSTIKTEGNLTDGLKCFFIYNPSSSPKSLTIQEKNSTAGTNYMFFDNTNAGWSDTYKYFVLGHLSYSRVCSMSKVGSSDQTNLWYATRSGNDWTGDGCFAYFGMIGSSSTFSDGAWASDNIYRASHYSAPLYKHLNLANGHNYLISKANNSNGGAITVEQKGNAYGSLNFTQTVKYQLSKNGGAYADMTASDGETPATITASSYKFNARTTVTNSSLDNPLTVNTTTRFSSTITAAYTGKTTLTVSNVRPGYKFIGWYEGNTQKSTNTSYTYRPTEAKTVTARFKKLYGFVEGRFMVKNVARNTPTYVYADGTWKTDQVSIPMEYEESNHRFVVHTHCTLEELKADIGSQDEKAPYFFIRTSPTTASISDGGNQYWATGSGDAYQKLDEGTGNANGKACTGSSNAFTFLGSSNTAGYVVIYCDGAKVWYELEYILDYDANGSDGGSIPAGRTYHLAGTTPTAATNANNLSKTGYNFNGWSTTSGVGQTPTYAAGATMSSMSADVKLYVAWAAQTYNIIYKDQGNVAYSGNNEGSLPPTHTYNIATALVDGTKEGYNFEGWYTIPACTGDPVTSLGATDYTSGDITLYAKWSAKTLNGTIDKTTGSANGSYSVTYMATSLTPSAPTKSGYHVNGYYLSYTNDAGKETFDIGIANANGNLLPSRSYDDKTYTNSSSEWIYDGTAPTIYAQWAGNSHTLTLMRNDGTETYASTSVTVGSNSYTIAKPTWVGYNFTGFYTAPSGGDKIINSDLTKPLSDYFDASSNWNYDDNVTLYAQWTPVDLTFSTAGSWGTASNWSPACVPTSGHDVTISAAATVSGAAVAKSIKIAGGSLTINAGAVLEVAGTITNTDASKLVIESNASNQGALILNNSSAATKATVDIYTKAAAYNTYQVIALPVTYAGVSESFAGSGVYTYVWNEGNGWERRGYYDDLSAFEAIGLVQNASHIYTISGTLASTEDFSKTLAYTTGTYQGTNVYGNSWTAPIKISEISIPAAYAEQTVYVLENGNWVAYTLGSVTNQVVPAMQAFAIKATASGGNVTIDYDVAVRGNTDYRTEALRAPQHTTSEGLEEMVLAISGDGKQTRLRLREDARFTEEFDNGWEATYLEGDGLSGQLFVQKDDKMVVLAEPDLEGTVVGLIPGVATDYTISFEGNGDGYYLNDLVTEQSTLIAEGNTYMFTADANTNATRFVISRTPIRNMPTGVDVINDGTKARKQLINDVLYIIRDGRLYNATGAKVK